MIAPLFLGFVLLLLGAVVVAMVRFLPGRLRLIVIAGLLLWMVYVGLISYLGLVRNITIRPPGGVFLFVPLVALAAFVIFQTRPSAGGTSTTAFPIWLLIGAQVFRVPVELFLYQLWRIGLIPQVLTFEGANVDIYIGATAPIIAWMATRGRVGLRVALIWNVLGLAALANVVIRAILTAPGPLNLIHAEVPDLMIGAFPYTYVPGFFVLLAVILHIVALRAVSKASASLRG